MIKFGWKELCLYILMVIWRSKWWGSAGDDPYQVQSINELVKIDFASFGSYHAWRRVNHSLCHKLTICLSPVPLFLDNDLKMLSQSLVFWPMTVQYYICAPESIHIWYPMPESRPRGILCSPVQRGIAGWTTWYVVYCFPFFWIYIWRGTLNIENIHKVHF